MLYIMMVIGYGGIRLILEEDKVMDIRDMLNTIITKVYENEREFLSRVYHYSEKLDSLELDSFYMASERCQLTLLSYNGSRFTDTVKTQDVLDWLEELDK